jgi:hypothetical protein
MLLYPEISVYFLPEEVFPGIGAFTATLFLPLCICIYDYIAMFWNHGHIALLLFFFVFQQKVAAL